MTAANWTRDKRRERILVAGSFDRLLDERDGEAILRSEAADAEDVRLISNDQLVFLLELRAERRKAAAKPQLLFSSEDVILIPGFMGSTLSDVSGPHGLIWIDPTLIFDKKGVQLSSLRLDGFQHQPEREVPLNDVNIQATSAIPAQYDLMSLYLKFWRYTTTIFPFDWRKDLEAAAQTLANQLRSRLGLKHRPLHIVAHSQGSLVARRGLQLLGADSARELVDNLVLLGPASYGSFSAAFALSGDPQSFELLRRFRVEPPSDFPEVLRSFTGLYQLLPWKQHSEAEFNPAFLGEAGTWKGKIDRKRLEYGFGWGERIDTAFFNDRTTIILGDQKMPGAIEFRDGLAVPVGDLVPGDGTVTDKNARLEGVRTYRLRDGVHATLPLYPTVQAAVRAILKGQTPSLESAPLGIEKADDVKTLKERTPPPIPAASKPAPKKARAPMGVQPAARPKEETHSPSRPIPLPPACRKLRVFSFDPLLATDLKALGIAEIAIDLPWDESLKPGPIGEYIEVIDYDPASRRFYHPVDLTHPSVIAQDGLKPSESNPQFHQQMVYAAAMSTITAFEKALGRVALWAPRLERNDKGEVISNRDDDGFVPRVRIYPHGIRGKNAYYDPELHAILFGYFSSEEQAGGDTIPGGTVFTCLSFDIIAHETSHALLHGLHRYFLYSSNIDLLAFHEAFADAVALFQNFAHPEVVEHQIARTRGNLRAENLLGQLARQFGSAQGEHRGALRRYIDTKPDPRHLDTAHEAHDRGAILMAAIFRAFLNIYENRTADLYRIATGGTGKLAEGEIHPDLVHRLALEASRSAKHMLTMCIRALDYVPPVDLTFGEYLRALITADYDLVRDDDRGYRVSILDAFRSWGIYPAGVNVLDEAAVLWDSPEQGDQGAVYEIVRKLDLTNWSSGADRRSVHAVMNKNKFTFRRLLKASAANSPDGSAYGVLIIGNSLKSIPRNAQDEPKFEVHSVRPCLRIGPDGQQRKDVVVEIVQKRRGYFSKQQQIDVDTGTVPAGEPDFWFRGGSTLIIDPETGIVRYCIGKSVLNEARLDDQREFARSGGHFSLAATYFGINERNPFALLHGDHTELLYGS